MTQLTEGMPAPKFEGKDQNGNSIKLSNYTGKKVVLYFCLLYTSDAADE